MLSQMNAFVALAVFIYLLFYKAGRDVQQDTGTAGLVASQTTTTLEQSTTAMSTTTTIATTTTVEPTTTTLTTTASTTTLTTTPISCATLNAPANGTVSHSAGAVPGDTATYTCDPCFVSSGGNSVRTCQLDGQWDGAELICTSAPAEFVMPFGSSCYRFVASPEISWHDAKAVCSSDGAKLVEIESAEEQAFVESHLDPSPTFWWIGGQDFVEDRVFVWDSTNLNVSMWPYTYFQPGEPNHNNNEDCLILWTEKNYHWGDDRCGDRYHAYICEL